MLTMVRDLEKKEEGFKQGFKEGFKEGFKIGFKEGIEQGIELGKEEIVLNLLELNYSNEEIHAMTCLPIEKIQYLRTQNGI